MVKVRLTRTMVVEYELVPEYYPTGYTFEQMAEMDANHDDREALFSECVSDDVKWEVIEELKVGDLVEVVKPFFWYDERYEIGEKFYFEEQHIGHKFESYVRKCKVSGR